MVWKNPKKNTLKWEKVVWLIDSIFSWWLPFKFSNLHHTVPLLRPAISCLADGCVAAVSARLTKGLVNNRPRDSSLLSGASSVWKLFLHVDTNRQERLWGGGCVLLSLCTGSKCAEEQSHSTSWCYCCLHILPRPIGAANNDEVTLQSLLWVLR